MAIARIHEIEKKNSSYKVQTRKYLFEGNVMSIDWIPARKISSKARGNRGIIPTCKNPNGEVVYDSCLERDFYNLGIHAPHVIRIQHQPITIIYKDENGKERRYTPDAYVEYSNGSKWLYEIKYEEDIRKNQKEYELKWKAADEWSKKKGISFGVLTQREIRTPRRENVWFTLGASKCKISDFYINKLISLIPAEGYEYNPLCYKLAEEIGVEIGKAAQILCYAIYHGVVFVDTFSTKHLSKDTIIRARKKKDEAPFKPLWEEFGIPTSDAHFDRSITEVIDKKNETKTLNFKIPEKYEETVSKREKIVLSWLQQPSIKRTPEWRSEFCKHFDVKERTVFRWIKKYANNGLEGLIPNHHNAGRPSRLNGPIMELLETARNHYLKPDGTLQKAYHKLCELCDEQHLKVPPRRTFEWYIYQNTTDAEFGKKKGKSYFKSHYTPALASFQGANISMQILQMDNSSVKIFPVDGEKREPLSTPYITAAIDGDSRMISGFSVSFFPPSSQTILEVLVQSMLPKKMYTDTFSTEFEWNMKGFPTLIMVDNGMDYQSKSLQEFCKKHDIIIEYVPIKTPRFKALIEQWFKILHKGMENEDVPATRPILKKRLENPDLKPEEDAVLTLQELEKWLHKWIIDEYHNRNKYDDHVLAPSLRLKAVQDGRTALILPQPREPPLDEHEISLLHLSTLEHFSRNLRYDGISWEYLRYNSTELSRIFSSIGGKKVKIFMDRRDVRQVWIINPITDMPLMVGLASGWAREIAKLYEGMPIHKSAWIKEVKTIKCLTNAKLTPLLYGKEKSLLQRNEIIKNGIKETKMVRKEKEKQRESMRKNQKCQNQEPALPVDEQLSEHEKEGNSEIDWRSLKPLPSSNFPKKQECRR